jgi:uncharacterized membrane protein
MLPWTPAWLPLGIGFGTKGGAYFGMPRHNYVGWLLTTFLVYLIAGLLLRGPVDKASETKFFASLPLFVYGLFAARYMTSNTVPALWRNQ